MYLTYNWHLILNNLYIKSLYFTPEDHFDVREHCHLNQVKKAHMLNVKKILFYNTNKAIL